MYDSTDEAFNDFCVNRLNEMKDNPSKFDWDSISLNPHLTRKHIWIFKDTLNLELMLEKKKITQEFYDELTKPLTRYDIMDLE